MSGLEIEVQTLDKKGYMSNSADTIINECKKSGGNIKVTKEFTKNVIEIQSLPRVKVQNTLLNAMETLQEVIKMAEDQGLLIYPLCVYPGRFKPKYTRGKYFRFKSRYIHDPSITHLETRRTAFHFHYALPRGVFDHKKKFLKMQIKSKIKQTLLDSYNLAIAMDPALVTLFQPSPILDGRYIAKDSGAIFQRSGKHLPRSDLAIYNRHPIFGGLPIYKHTIADLIYTINRRYKKVKEIVRKNNLDRSIQKRYKRVLDYSWHAVRINKIGTLEHRTMDMNHPKYVIAGTVLLKYIHRKVQQDFLRVIPSDVGISHPFKQEGDKLHIPPHTYVRKKLQRWSVCEGFERKEILNYTRRLFSFGKRCTPPKFYPAIRPFERMIERKKSVSDVMMRKLEKWGYGKDDVIPDEVCAKLALSSCRQLYKEIEQSKKKIEDLTF